MKGDDSVSNGKQQTNNIGGQPLHPIPQNHVHGFANGGQGESFPLWEFEGETLKVLSPRS